MNLLPKPQQLTLTGGEWNLPDSGCIALNVPCPADVFFTARRAQTALRDYAGAQWSIAGGDLPAPLTFILEETAVHASHPEGYRLTIGEQGIQIAAGDNAWPPCRTSP